MKILKHLKTDKEKYDFLVESYGLLFTEFWSDVFRQYIGGEIPVIEFLCGRRYINDLKQCVINANPHKYDFLRHCKDTCLFCEMGKYNFGKPYEGNLKICINCPIYKENNKSCYESKSLYKKNNVSLINCIIHEWHREVVENG